MLDSRLELEMVRPREDPAKGRLQFECALAPTPNQGPGQNGQGEAQNDQVNGLGISDLPGQGVGIDMM